MSAVEAFELPSPEEVPSYEPVEEVYISKKRRREMKAESDAEAELLQQKKRQKAALMPMSEEQARLVDHLVHKRNVTCAARAGSGKTTTMLHAAKAFYKRHGTKTLLLIYSQMLKNETRERIKDLGIGEMVECENYHSCAINKFVGNRGGGSVDNNVIHSAIKVGPVKPYHYGLILVDEAQDMTELYKDFVNHVVAKNLAPTTLALIGDSFQTLYAFQNAKSNFLMEAGQFFQTNLVREGFTLSELTISWRISHEMADFINTHLNPRTLKTVDPVWYREHGARLEARWGKGIRANPNRPADPDSMIFIDAPKDHYRTKSRGLEALRDMYAEFGDGNVAILAMSTKSGKSPTMMLVNKEGGANWCVVNSDTAISSAKGKRLVATVFKVKGCEFDGVLATMFGSYGESNNGDWISSYNVRYTAATRARKRLVILSTDDKPYATIRGTLTSDKRMAKYNGDVNESCAYVPYCPSLSDVGTQFSYLHEIELGEQYYHHRMNEKVTYVAGREPGTNEDVTVFFKVVIMFGLSLVTQEKVPRFEVNRKTTDKDLIEYYDEFFAMNLVDQANWCNLFRLAVAYVTCMTGYKHYWRQLKDTKDESIPIHFLEGCTLNALEMIRRIAVSQELIEDGADFYHILKFNTLYYTPFLGAWYVNNSKLPYAYGFADVTIGDKYVVSISCSDDLSCESAMHIAMVAATKDAHARQPEAVTTPIVMVPNVGKSYMLQDKLEQLSDRVPVYFQRLHSVLRRKLTFDAAEVEEMVQNKDDSWGFDRTLSPF